MDGIVFGIWKQVADTGVQVIDTNERVKNIDERVEETSGRVIDIGERVEDTSGRVKDVRERVMDAGELAAFTIPLSIPTRTRPRSEIKAREHFEGTLQLKG